jgi:hypothetical protein
MPTPASVETPEAQLASRLREVVRHRPFAAVAAAGLVGAVLGGIAFSRLGRLAFLVLAGYAANELWRRDGKIIDRVASEMKAI